MGSAALIGKVVTVATSLVVWVGLTSLPLSHAGCLPPELRIKEGVTTPLLAELKSGSTLHVLGEGFGPCDDTPGDGGAWFGCSGDDDDEVVDTTLEAMIQGPVPQKVLRDEKRMEVLKFGRGEYGADFSDVRFERTVELGEVMTEPDGTLDEEIQLPGLEPGRYFLTIGYVVTQFKVVR